MLFGGCCCGITDIAANFSMSAFWVWMICAVICAIATSSDIVDATFGDIVDPLPTGGTAVVTIVWW